MPRLSFALYPLHPSHRTWMAVGLLFVTAWGGDLSQIVLAKPSTVSPPAHREQLDSRFARYTLETGTAIEILLQTSISTAYNHVGDPVEGIVTHNIYFEEEKLVPHSTRVFGLITKLEPAIEGRDGIMEVHFTTIKLDAVEEKLPMTAHVRTERPDHTWGGTVTKGTKPYISTQRVSGIGDYNRIVMGGPRAMGKAIEMQGGDFWTLILDSPLIIVKGRPPQEYSEGEEEE
jgi:hypothetical protein